MASSNDLLDMHHGMRVEALHCTCGRYEDMKHLRHQWTHGVRIQIRNLILIVKVIVIVENRDLKLPQH
jgi:hypothetical protein